MIQSRPDSGQDEHLPLLTLYIIILIYAAIIILAFSNVNLVRAMPLDPEIHTTWQLPINECNTRRLKKFKHSVPTMPLMVWWASVQTERDGLMEFDRVFNCPICLDVVSKSQLIHTLSCRHVFHDQCLEGWVSAGHNSCPICLMSLQADYIL